MGIYEIDFDDLTVALKNNFMKKIIGYCLLIIEDLSLIYLQFFNEA